jgi:predicted DNA-binding transcriptional regulator YafY
MRLEIAVSIVQRNEREEFASVLYFIFKIDGECLASCHVGRISRIAVNFGPRFNGKLEEMLGTSARLLRLLALFQGRRYWSGADLAERLEVTSRTLRRDVDKLRTLGYPIQSTSGAEGGYQLSAGSTMPPLLLDDEEAIAVAFGLRCAAIGAIEGVEEASMRALSKIEQILPVRLGRRLAALQAMIVTPPRAQAAVSAAVLSVIAGACRDSELLRFRYRDHSGAMSSRSVEPHRLVHTGRRWYLVAWDREREDWRTFRADRIRPTPATGERVTPRDPPAADLAAYVARGAWFAPPCRAKVKLMAPADAIAQRVPSGIGMIEPIDQESCYFDSGASTYESLAMHLIFFGVDFEVTEPPELMDEVRKLSDRYGRAARHTTPRAPRKARVITSSGGVRPVQSSKPITPW